MSASSSGIKIETIGFVKPDETSPVVAMYLDKDIGYGFLMHLNGAFYYFSYNKNEQYW